MARFRDNPIVAFYQELKDCTRQSRFYNPPRDFVLASRLLEWLRERPEEDETSARAMIILETVYNRREPWAGAWNYFDVSMDKGHRQCWLKLLVILLQIAPDGSFARLLHVFNTAEIWDSKLSEVHRQESDLMRIVETTGIYSVEDCHDAVRGFLQRATELSTQKAITLNHGRELQPHVLLPITAKDPIDSGGQSNVFRIEVPLECISEEVAVYLEDLHYQARQDDHYSDGKSFYYELALKKIALKAYWETEILAHQAFRALKTEGIVQCLGSWKIHTATGTDYYLVMEYGLADLNQYFRSTTPPSIGQHIYEFWTSLLRVVPALSHIHDLRISSNRFSAVQYYGWHGDIKLANILYCEDGIKLTDPGWAQIVPPEDVQKDAQGFPIVALRGGTGSYGGPERFDQDTGKIDGTRPVTQRFDIWSLACVFLEAATWVILGIRGVDQFRIARKRAHRRSSSDDKLGDGDDCFHHLGLNSYVVGDWIAYLRHGIRADDVVSAHILDIIEKEMLIVEPHQRIGSETLARHISGTLRSCEDKLKALPRYTFPLHFAPAFDEEQDIAAKDSEDPQLRKSSAKLMLNRSVRFAQARGPLMDQPFGHSVAGPRTSGSHLATDPAQYNFQSQHTPQDQYIYAQYSQQAQSGQRSSAVVAKPPNRSPVRTPTRNSADTIPPLQKEKKPKFDYYDALYMLVSNRSWIYSSVLESESRLKPRAVDDSRPTKDVRPHGQPKEKPARASTFSLMRTTSMKKGEQPSPYTSGVSQAFHTIFGRSGKTSKTSGGNITAASIPRARPGAEPVQSMPRNKSFGDLFTGRDIIILVDNSSSMARHWPQVQDILQVLMAMMWGQDEDGIDLFFTSSTVPYPRLTEPWQVTDPLKEKDPTGIRLRTAQLPSAIPATEKDPDDIYEVLSHILRNIGPRQLYRKKATILILTDGVWPSSNLDVVAREISHWLLRAATVRDGATTAVLNDRYYSIQFVQLGDDPVGTEVLGYLDDDLKHDYPNTPDVIDAEPANGNVLKMVMGSLDDIWDEYDAPKTPRDTPSPTAEASGSGHQVPTSPPAPLPSQFMHQRIGAGNTWNSTSTARGVGAVEPIFEEDEASDQYTVSATRQQPFVPPRGLPLGPDGTTSYTGLGLPLRQQYAHGAHGQQYFTPQQLQRRTTNQSFRGGIPSPPEDSPSLPPRRRNTGGYTGVLSHNRG